jgi:hypothetical protein
MSQIRFSDSLKHKDLDTTQTLTFEWHEPSPDLEDHAVSTIIQNSYPPDILRRPGLLDITLAGRKLVAVFCAQKLQSILETYKFDLEMRSDPEKPWDGWDDKYELAAEVPSVAPGEDGDDPYAEYFTKFRAQLRSSQFIRR